MSIIKWFKKVDKEDVGTSGSKKVDNEDVGTTVPVDLMLKHKVQMMLHVCVLTNANQPLLSNVELTREQILLLHKWKLFKLSNLTQLGL